MNEVSNKTEEIVTIEEASINEIENTKIEDVQKSPRIKKHIVAKEIIEKAKHIVHTSEKELNACKLLLENDLREYTDAKEALNEGGLEESKILLVELDYTTIEALDKVEEPIVEIENDVEPITVKEIYSGRFTGVISSLIAGTLTLGGLAFLATQKLGMTLDINKVPNLEVINKISHWYADIINMGENVQIGMGLIILIVLVVMSLVYALRVGLKSDSNLHFANMQMQETQKLVEKKQNCKTQMEKVDAHINDAIATLKAYQVLLNEQNGKLHRIIYFEKKEAKTQNYATSSKEEMDQTKDLIVSVQALISQPLLEKNKLTNETVHALSEAKEKIESFLKRFI